jgi:uncharacterized membrane protein
MSIRVQALVERARSSLFFVPLLLVLAGAALGSAMVEIDAAIGDDATRFPLVLTSTVDSAREVLGVVAAATMTVAGIAFSVSLLVIQQASSRYSPRVVHSLFRDPFNRRVMGLAVGTFTYCLMVLRAVRAEVEGSGGPVIPNLSVALALVLGVASILAIVAFIDHNAHTLEVSQILDRVTRDTTEQIERNWPRPDEVGRDQPGDAPDPGPVLDVAGARDLAPDRPGHVVALTAPGWIQQLDLARLALLAPAGGTVRLETAPGRYAIEGAPLCTVWPEPDDADTCRADAADAVQVGPVRTMQQDPTYGIRQLADVALIALSPGVNDPTTAQDAIFHLASAVRHGLCRDLPGIVTHEGRTLLLAEHPTHESLVELAFDEVRRAGADQPAVAIYLLEAFRHVREALDDAGLPERFEPLARQARLVLAGAARADLLPDDLDTIRAIYRRNFGD